MHPARLMLRLGIIGALRNRKAATIIGLSMAGKWSNFGKQELKKCPRNRNVGNLWRAKRCSRSCPAHHIKSISAKKGTRICWQDSAVDGLLDEIAGAR